jgi:hypothetical protein
MDKGYDSEKIHFIIKEEIKADSIIPVREKKRKKISGKYEKLLTLVFDKIKYNQRNIVETIFSVVKRKLGEILGARKFRYKIKEIKIKLITCEINKKVIEIICIKLRISAELKLDYFLSYCHIRKNIWNSCVHLSEVGTVTKNEIKMRGIT